jgi:hypothetical protein
MSFFTKQATKLAFVAFAVVAGWAYPATAQEIPAEHLAAAREAVAASNATNSLDIILPRLGEEAKARMINERPDASEKIGVLVDEITISLAARRANLEDEVARIYARIFTMEELKQLTAFYKSEAGVKLIKETPVIARSIEDAARVWSGGIQRDLADAIRKKVEEGALN